MIVLASTVITPLAGVIAMNEVAAAVISILQAEMPVAAWVMAGEARLDWQ